tara:strand:- start:926 stop:1171 length:246 start_codon:yes stop_codon:yes gene_type:complete
MKTIEEIEKLATAKYGRTIYSIDEVESFKEGYTQCQEDMADKDKRIKELEEVAIELFNLVHDSDLIQNKIRANDLYDIIKP